MKRGIFIILFVFLNWLFIFISPAIFFICRIFKVDKEKIERFILNCNTKLVTLKNIKVSPSQILILLPRCIQNSECINKVTIDIENCKKCGKCQIAEIINIGKNKGVKIAVATGGSIARKIVTDIKPKAIIAVACERELFTGVSDTGNLPVMAVVNIRPYGPCINTGVDMNQVKSAIEFFTGRG